MTDWKSSLRTDPMPWLLDNACPATRYRVLTELMELKSDDPDVKEAKIAAHSYTVGLQLEKKQKNDGTWGTALHAGDARKYLNCTENSLWRLFEFGWNRDTKAVRLSAKMLRQFLTAKKDLPFYEYAKAVKADESRERYYRWFLRILALGMLIRAGYTEDKNRNAVLELLDLTAGFVDNPASRKPVEEIGAALPLIRFEAFNHGYPFFPDFYSILVFAHSDWLLQGELAKMRLKKIFDYMMSPLYQDLAPDLGLVRTSKGSFARSNGIKLMPLDHYQKKGHLDELLVQLELFSRLGLVNRYPILMAQLDWLQGLQGKDGRWNLSTKQMNDSSRWIHLLRLEKDWRSPTRKEADLTFRMLLILKNQWERQILMLGRRDDSYPI
jgi:hypothetical protein